MQEPVKEEEGLMNLIINRGGGTEVESYTICDDKLYIAQIHSVVLCIILYISL